MTTRIREFHFTMNLFKRLALFFGSAVMALAGSCTITSPTASQTISGTAFPFSVSLTSVTNPDHVQYMLDNTYPATNFGLGAKHAVAISDKPSSYSYLFNTNEQGNGAHSVTANVYKADNTLLTSCSQAYTSSNQAPGTALTPTFSTTYVTSPPSWSGTVSLHYTITGIGADGSQCSAFIDGITVVGAGQCNENPVYIATYLFPNGTHLFCASGYDTTAHIEIGEQCDAVTFSNGSVGSQVVSNADKFYITPTGTFTLVASMLNTDGAPGSGTPTYASLNTAVATVNSSTGVVTAVASGSTGITQWIPGVITGSGTLGTLGGACTGVFVASGTPLTAAMIGWQLQVTGGSGWTTGVYTVGSAKSGLLTLDRCPASVGATGGSFTAGPVNTSWGFVWPTNIMPYIGSDGTINTSYNPANAFYLMSMFNSQSTNLLFETYNDPVGTVASGGENAVEPALSFASISGTETSGSPGLTAWQASQASYASTYTSLVAPYPNLKFYFQAQAFTSTETNMWGGTYGPASQWSTPALAAAIQSFVGYGVGVTFGDEISNSWGSCPLCGPIVPGAGTGQSWLENIVASSGSCTANSNGPFSMNGTKRFVIHGSSQSPLNNSSGNTYTWSGSGSSFTFACAGVANGTYDSTTDAGLTIEPLAANWVVGNSDYPRYDTFSRYRTQAHSVTGGFGITAPPVGTTIGATCSSFAVCNPVGTRNPNNGFQNYGGAQSGYVIGSNAQFGDFSDIYPAGGSSGNYLRSRWQGSSVSFITGSGGDSIGWTLRQLYGHGYSPDLPYLVLTNGNLAGGGGQGGVTPNASYSVALTGCVGDTCIFSAPHGITNIVPGLSKLQITGSSDVGSPLHSASSPGYYYIDSCPTPITCKLLLAGTSFTAIGTNGSIQWPDGTTKALNTTAPGYGICSATNAAGNQSTNCRQIITGIDSCWNYQGAANGGWFCSAFLQYNGSVDANITRHRGQNFTLSSVKAFLITSTLGPFAITTGVNDTFTLTVNGGSPQTITLSAGSNSATTVANLINSSMTGVTASVLSSPLNAIYLTGSVSSNTSSLVVGSGNANTTLGFTNAQTNDATPFNTHTFRLDIENINGSAPNTVLAYREVPSLKSTGGSARIILSTNAVKGTGPWTAYSTVNPGFAQAQDVEAWIMRATGVRIYKADSSLNEYTDQKGFVGDSPQSWVSKFDSSSTSQVYMNPHYENYDAVPLYWSHSIMGHTWGRWLKYSLQPAATAPDLGQLFDCGSRSGSFGVITVCLNVSDGVQPVTVPVSPISGQKLLWHTLSYWAVSAINTASSGTTSVTTTLGPNESIWIVQPNNFSSELVQPSLSYTLPSGASKMLVRWTYDRYYLDVLPDAFVCTSTPCVPPWDSGFGKIYYELWPEDSGDTVLAKGAETRL